MKKTALIVGSSGQDGKFLEKFLQGKSYTVHGFNSKNVDILDAESVENKLKTISPDEVYYLAAFHHSSESLPLNPDEILKRSRQVHVEGFRNFLSKISPESKIFYASSSHVFSGSDGKQDERYPQEKSSPYATTKIEGMALCHEARKKGIFASVGILYNHESPFRSPDFVSRKITSGVAKIHLGLVDKLELGDLDSEIDWGYAGDYVDAMWRILQLQKPDDFIIATGVSHIIRDFVEVAFSSVGRNWKDHVVINKNFLKKTSHRRIGNPQKIKAATGWVPMTSFESMIDMMVKNDLELLRNE